MRSSRVWSRPIDGLNTSSSPFFSQSVAGAQPQHWIGLTSILYGICLLLIPVISFFVLRADFVGLVAPCSVLSATADAGSRLMALSTSRQGGSGYGRPTVVAGKEANGGATYRNLSRPPDDTPRGHPRLEVEERT